MDLIESGRASLTEPAHLKASARVVLGLLLMEFDEETIASILRAKPDELAQFCKMLRASRHPVIVGCFERMPPNAAVLLPNEETVRCRSCGGTVALVPCPACSTLEFRPE